MLGTFLWCCADKQINSKVARDTRKFSSTSDRELCCLKAPGTSSEDEGIPKHVLAGEQLAGDGFYKTNTASEEIVEIVIADAFFALFLTRSFGPLNQLGIAV